MEFRNFLRFSEIGARSPEILRDAPDHGDRLSPQSFSSGSVDAEGDGGAVVPACQSPWSERSEKLW